MLSGDNFCYQSCERNCTVRVTSRFNERELHSSKMQSDNQEYVNDWRNYVRRKRRFYSFLSHNLGRLSGHHR